MTKSSSMVHILVLLKYVGSYGNEASLQKVGQMMGISEFSIYYYVTWACDAILKHCDQVIKWPNEEVRRNISGRIRNSCIGVIDGTLFPLDFAPTVNAEDYFTRKGDYAIRG